MCVYIYIYICIFSYVLINLQISFTCKYFIMERSCI